VKYRDPEYEFKMEGNHFSLDTDNLKKGIPRTLALARVIEVFTERKKI
jgi:DNA polymerase III sliding clamp (beta) subunit (PCNA family)